MFCRHVFGILSNISDREFCENIKRLQPFTIFAKRLPGFCVRFCCFYLLLSWKWDTYAVDNVVLKGCWQLDRILVPLYPIRKICFIYLRRKIFDIVTCMPCHLCCHRDFVFKNKNFQLINIFFLRVRVRLNLPFKAQARETPTTAIMMQQMKLYTNIYWK